MRWAGKSGAEQALGYYLAGLGLLREEGSGLPLRCILAMCALPLVQQLRARRLLRGCAWTCRVY